METVMELLIVYPFYVSLLLQAGTKGVHDWMEKVIHWELCKSLKFDYSN